MQRVLGAGIIVLVLGGAHLARWAGERPAPAPPYAAPSAAPASPRPRAAAAAPVTPYPVRYHGDPLRFLNTAPVDSLELLPGIGPVLAARIAADRAARGPFTAWTELDRVRGIGPATIRRLEEAARRP